MNYRPLFWISLCGLPCLASLNLLPMKGTSGIGFSSRRDVCNVETVGNATDIFQAEKDPAPAALGHLVHRLSPDSLVAARAIPTAEAMGGRCPTLERLEFGLLNRRPSFRAPEWVELNFRSFSLGGKGLVRGHTGVAGFHAPPTALPPVT